MGKLCALAPTRGDRREGQKDEPLSGDALFPLTPVCTLAAVSVNTVSCGDEITVYKQSQMPLARRTVKPCMSLCSPPSGGLSRPEFHPTFGANP